MNKVRARLKSVDSKIVINFIKENGLTQASVGKSLGVSPSLISQYLKETYKGDVKAFEDKLLNYINNYYEIDNSRDIDSKPKIIRTVDLRMTKFNIDEAVVGNDIVLIYGKSGSGKTTAISEYKKDHPTTVLVEAIPTMSLKSLLTNICNEINIQTVSSAEAMIRNIANAFKIRSAVLIIDEAENLTTKTLEAIRRIWDFSQVPTVLVGTPAIVANLKGRNGELIQLYSRVAYHYEFIGLSNDDWTALFGNFGDVLLNITSNLRQATNIYKRASRLAKLNEIDLNKGLIKEAAKNVILG